MKYIVYFKIDRNLAELTPRNILNMLIMTSTISFKQLTQNNTM